MHSGNRNFSHNAAAWLRGTLLVGLVVLAMPGTSIGQKLPMFDDEGDLLLSAQFKVLSDIARTNIPTPLEIPLIWRGDRLLNGHLHYSIFTNDPDDPILKMVSPPLTLDTIPRQMHTMLPPISDSLARSGVLFVQLQFIEDGNDEPFDLETHSMQLGVDPASSSHQRVRNLSIPALDPHQSSAHTIAVVHSGFGTNFGVRDHERMWWKDYGIGIRSLLTLEAEQTMFKSNPYWARYPPTMHFAELSPSTVPVSPIQFTSYDVVSIQEGIDVVNNQQRAALAKWVRSGGGLILTVPATASDWLPATEFLLDAHAISAPDFPLPEPTMLTCDLGKILLVPTDYTTVRKVKKEMLVNELPFLRKPTIRNSADLSASVVIHEDKHTDIVNRLWNSDAYVAPVIGSDTGDLLAPPGLYTLPVRSIVICLALFLLAAAPLDYYYLGIVRRRNLTWIIYPVAALFCSWLVMRATADRITGKDNGTWEIITLGVEGTPLRKESFRLLLNNRHTNTHFDGQDSLQDNLRIVYDPHFYPYSSRPDTADDSGQLKDWTITGNYPARYTSTMRLARLTPAVEHTETYFPDLDVPDIVWDEISPWQVSNFPDFMSYRERVAEFAQQLSTENVQVHASAYIPFLPDHGGDQFFAIGEGEICVPCTRLTADMACAAVTLQEGNHFTTYLRLIPRPSASLLSR